MPDRPFERVAVIAQSHLRFLHADLARFLREQHGSHVTLYCFTEAAARFYEGQSAYDAVVLAPSLTHNPAARTAPEDVPDLMRRARALEDRLGTTMNRVALSNRHLGRGYALGGHHHPRSRQSDRTSYVDMVASIVRTLEYWEEEFRTERTTLLLNPTAETGPVARSIRIPMRRYSWSRYLNYYMWVDDEYLRTPRVQQRYEGLDEAAGGDIEAPGIAHLVNRDRALEAARVSVLARKAASHTARRWYGRLRGSRSGYHLRSELRYLYRQWRDVRRMTGNELAALEDLPEPFVFFPLHTEPEYALQVLSPENFYQHSTIAGISRDLPAGVRLAVKETPVAAGRRPTDFYDQLLELKNVVMLDMREHGLEVVRRSAALCTITGTAGFEAAVLGTPVITFGRNNLYSFLPHVRVITDEADLRPALRDALGGGIDRELARKDGRRFLRAVLDLSVDMEDYTEAAPDAYGTPLLEAVARNLTTTLAEDETGVAAV